MFPAARDCLYLGKHSFNNGYYGQALEWFEEAMTRAHREGNTTAPVDEIRPFYTMAATIVSQRSVKMFSMSDTRLSPCHLFTFSNTQYDDLLPEYEKNATFFSNSSQPALMRFLDGDNDDFRNYQALCRGDSLRVSRRKRKAEKMLLSLPEKKGHKSRILLSSSSYAFINAAFLLHELFA